MPSSTKIPLGYIDLPSGPKAIYPMNDIFLNYIFEDRAYWEALRQILNIIINAYRQTNPDTQLQPVEGTIEVKTQYKHLLADSKVTRDQDIKMTEEEGAVTYIEFQNKATTNPPITIRSVEYFGLGIGHNKGKTANQIWLLAEDVNAVLLNKTYARYILKDEQTGHTHPQTSGILYVSLNKLSQEKGKAGELASYLLGKPGTPVDENTKNIITAIDAGFNKFKQDKDVVSVISFQDRWYDEGKVEGKVEGKAEGEAIGKAKGLNRAIELIELIRRGLTLDEAQRLLEEEATA